MDNILLIRKNIDFGRTVDFLNPVKGRFRPIGHWDRKSLQPCLALQVCVPVCVRVCLCVCFIEGHLSVRLH